MPLDRSNAHPQENGNSGRLKLVLRLDKPKNADTGEKEASPASADTRPKRTPNAKTTTHHAEDTYYSADKKIPKKHEEQGGDHEDYEHRPTRKRKAPMDSNFVYSKKHEHEHGDEDEDEEKIEYKKPKKKVYKDAGGTEEWEDDSVPTPPLTDHDTHSGFKLKLKLPKPRIPDDAEQTKNKKPEVSSGDGKKKKRMGEEIDETEATTPRSGMKLKIKSSTPVEQKADGGSLKKPKAEPAVTPKRYSPPRREDSSMEKREARLQSRERPKPEPKIPSVPLDEDSAKMRKHLSGIVAQLVKLDKQFYFTEPVTEDIAPMYFSIISHPMDFKTMRKKLKEGKYKSVEAVQADFQLICNNCMTYNPAQTTYAREAKRMLTVGNRLLEKYLDGTAMTSTTEHKPETKKEFDKTPTRHATPNSAPNKSFTSKPSTPGAQTTPNRAAPAPPNATFGVAFPISSGQLSSMQHPISTTPQHPPYPVTPPMRKPPAYPTLTPPYSQRLPMSNSNLPSVMRPPPSMPLQKSMSTNSIFPRPNMGPPAPPASANAPPRPQNPVGKPGSRPPVVSMNENQATQTQAMYPEQPKRKYVKPVEEPPKPAPPQPVMKAPAKLVAKIGTIPLVTPANVPGSFVYSMYIPRFEPGAVPGSKSSTETTSTPSTSSSSTTPASPPTSTTTTTTSTTTPPTPSSPPPPTTKTANGNLAINFASVNYVNNFVSVPSLHHTLPAPSAQDADDAWLRAPAKRVEENVELMEEIAHDCLDAMDSDSREQMLGFFTSIAQLQSHAPLAFPKFATQALLPRAQPLQQPIKVIHQTAKPPPVTPFAPFITGNPLLDAELADQLSKLESLEITAQDLKQLQGLHLDLAELSSFLPTLSSLPPADSPPASTTNSSPAETTTTTTTSATSLLSSPPASPPTSPISTTTTTITPPTPTLTDKAQASKIVQDILDKNLEHLWSLQLMQHERVASSPSEAELKLASQICDGLFVLGTSIPPFMLTTKEAAKAAIEQSGLVTGKYRHMRV